MNELENKTIICAVELKQDFFGNIILNNLGEIDLVYARKYIDNDSLLVFGNHKYEEHDSNKYNLDLIEHDIIMLNKVYDYYYLDNIEEKKEAIKEAISFCDTSNDEIMEKLLSFNLEDYSGDASYKDAGIMCRILKMIDNCRWDYNIADFEDKRRERQVFYYKTDVVPEKEVYKIIDSYCLNNLNSTWEVIKLSYLDFMKAEDTDDLMNSYYDCDYYCTFEKNDYEYIKKVLIAYIDYNESIVCLLDENEPIHDKSLEELVQASKEKLGIVTQPEADFEEEEEMEYMI